MTTYQPCRCIHCGKAEMIRMDSLAFAEWKAGRRNISTIPGLTADQREMLISSTCPDCFPSDPDELDNEHQLQPDADVSALVQKPPF